MPQCGSMGCGVVRGQCVLHADWALGWARADAGEWRSHGGTWEDACRAWAHLGLLGGLQQHLHVRGDERLGVEQAGLAHQQHGGVDDQVLGLRAASGRRI